METRTPWSRTMSCSDVEQKANMDNSLSPLPIHCCDYVAFSSNMRTPRMEHDKMNVPCYLIIIYSSPTSVIKIYESFPPSSSSSSSSPSSYTFALVTLTMNTGFFFSVSQYMFINLTPGFWMEADGFNTKWQRKINKQTEERAFNSNQ